MSRKKKAAVRARKVRSHGLWIAPDLERTIKGEGGRRGLIDPPYSYYLQLADLVLGPGPAPPVPVAGRQMEPDREEFSPGQKKSAMLPSTDVSRNSEQGLDSIPLTKMQVARPTKRPKLTLPKPRPAKRSKLAAPKPPKRPDTPKPSISKPPKRRG